MPNGFLIPAGARRYFNAFAVAASSNQIDISSRVWFDLEQKPLDNGTYKIKLEVSGKYCPVTYHEFTIQYLGGNQLWVYEE